MNCIKPLVLPTITINADTRYLVDDIEVDLRPVNIPNHGSPAVIANGGYRTTLIDATVDYLHRMVSHAHDPNYLQESMESYVQDSIDKGWVTPWWAYHEAHENNLNGVFNAYKDRPLPAERSVASP